MTSITLEEVLDVAAAGAAADLWTQLVSPVVDSLRTAITDLYTSLDAANGIHDAHAEHEIIPEDTRVVDAGQLVNDLMADFQEATTSWSIGAAQIITRMASGN